MAEIKTEGYVIPSPDELNNAKLNARHEYISRFKGLSGKVTYGVGETDERVVTLKNRSVIKTETNWIIIDDDVISNVITITPAEKIVVLSPYSFEIHKVTPDSDTLKARIEFEEK